MPNKLVRRLLMVSIAVFTTLSMAILTLPFDTQTQAQRTFQPSPGNAPKESTCIPKSDRPPDVQFPEVYDNKKLPALIILPQTGGTPSGSYFRSFGNQDKGLTSFGEKHKKRTENPFAVVLFDIEGAESDWKPGTNFEPAIKRCEKFLEKIFLV